MHGGCHMTAFIQVAMLQKVRLIADAIGGARPLSPPCIAPIGPAHRIPGTAMPAICGGVVLARSAQLLALKNKESAGLSRLT